MDSPNVKFTRNEHQTVFLCTFQVQIVPLVNVFWCFVFDVYWRLLIVYWNFSRDLIRLFLNGRSASNNFSRKNLFHIATLSMTRKNRFSPECSRIDNLSSCVFYFPREREKKGNKVQTLVLAFYLRQESHDEQVFFYEFELWHA